MAKYEIWKHTAYTNEIDDNNYFQNDLNSVYQEFDTLKEALKVWGKIKPEINKGWMKKYEIKEFELVKNIVDGNCETLKMKLISKKQIKNV